MSDISSYTKNQSYWLEYLKLSCTSGVYVIVSDAKWKCSYPFGLTSKSTPAHSHHCDLREYHYKEDVASIYLVWVERKQQVKTVQVTATVSPRPTGKALYLGMLCHTCFRMESVFCFTAICTPALQAGVLTSNYKPRGIISHIPYGLFQSLHLRYALNLPQGKVRKLDFWYFPTGTLV